MTLVSVVIPAHNAAPYLRDAIDSVLEQTYPRVEIIVVDDGSTDATAEIIGSYGSKISSIGLQQTGVAHARNVGAKESNGDVVAFLDADDLWLPRKLEFQMQVLIQDPSVGLVYTALHLVDEDLRFIGRQVAPPGERALWNTLMIERPIMCGIGTGIIPKEVFDEAGGFDERLSSGADCDLACRIAVRHRVSGIDMPLLMYRQHGSQMHRNPETTFHDMDLIFKKFFDEKVAPAWMLPYKNRAYANLYVSLAGGALMRKDRRSFTRYIARAIGRRPDRVLDAIKRLSDPTMGPAPAG